MAIRAKREPRLETRQLAFPHQAAAVEAIKNMEYAAIFHEQGLGKTKIALDLAVSWLSGGSVDSVLVVTKRTLIENWRKEIRFHTYMSPVVLSQDKRQNFYAFNSPARLYLAHYEVCKTELKRLLLFLETRKVGVILDESHKIKNPDTDVTKALLKMSGGFVRRVIMTGTPVANRPFDLWAQIKFLDGGLALGGSFAEFRSATDLSYKLALDDDRRSAFETTLSDVQGKIVAFSVRETKKSSGISLPGKQIQNVTVELEPRQEELYQALKNELRVSVEREGVVKEENVEEILKRLVRLVQVASNPRLVDHGYDLTPGKLPHLLLLLDAAVDSGDKAIVWTNFIDNAEWLVGELDRRYPSVVVHGKRAIVDRNRALSQFMDNPSIKVLVATPGAAKEGLTLTAANHAVFFDRSFSLDDYLQAQDRIHRISQTKECFITNLVGKNTVDEWVDALLAAKHLAAGLAQGDIELPEYRDRASYSFSLILDEVLGRRSTLSIERSPH